MIHSNKAYAFVDMSKYPPEDRHESATEKYSSWSIRVRRFFPKNNIIILNIMDTSFVHSIRNHCLKTPRPVRPPSISMNLSLNRSLE